MFNYSFYTKHLIDNLSKNLEYNNYDIIERIEILAHEWLV